MYIVAIILSFLILSCAKQETEPESSVSVQICPSTVSPSSNLDIDVVSEAAVSIGTKTTTWQWQLKGTINTSYGVDVYDIDLFDTPEQTITDLKDAGKKVICYFSAGSSENWRSDYHLFNNSDLGSNLDGWDGERWLDVRSQNVFNIMKARMDLAKSKGCDGVEPDNMDGYMDDNDQCFGYSADDQLAYNKAIANYARSIGLSVGLKNDADQVTALVSYFDFSVTEQCYQYSECDAYASFVDNNKPVFNAEYLIAYRSDPDRSSLCNYSTDNNIRTLVLDLGLDDSYRFSCD